MIIDSHAHYCNSAYRKPFRYLAVDEGEYTVREGELPQLLSQLESAGILGSIEPGVDLASCAHILEFCREHPGRVFPAIGLHPTRCIFEAWANRRQLMALAESPGVVAIGETGLDYHFPRHQQQRLKQHIWFLYQLELARKLQKPVILHVRDAHEAALRILRIHPARKLGGVIHCFHGSWETARQYLDLGYHIGIGGSALQQPERAEPLWEAIRQIPLERILLETDAPYILPYCKDVLPSKLVRRAKNTSLILPTVALKIAELKNITPEEVEAVTTQNTIRLFRLPEKLFRNTDPQEKLD